MIEAKDQFLRAESSAKSKWYNAAIHKVRRQPRPPFRAKHIIGTVGRTLLIE